MIGTAIGGAAALLSSAVGAIGSAVTNKRARNLLSLQREENKQWFEQERAKDYTQRSDVQNIINKQRKLLDEQYKRARATNVISGGTDEALAMQQAAANDAVANTMSDVAAQASIHADNVQQQYRNVNSQLTQQEIGVHQQTANNVAAAAGQGIQAGLGLVGTDINKPIKETK